MHLLSVLQRDIAPATLFVCNGKRFCAKKLQKLKIKNGFYFILKYFQKCFAAFVKAWTRRLFLIFFR